MSWTAAVAVLCGFAGLGALFALGWRLFRQVMSLGRTVAEMSERIAVASAGLPGADSDDDDWD